MDTLECCEYRMHCLSEGRVPPAGGGGGWSAGRPDQGMLRHARVSGVPGTRVDQGRPGLTRDPDSPDQSAGPATCDQTLKVVEGATVEGTRSNVVSNFTNKQVNCFSSLHLSNTNSTAVPTETGQIWCGQHGDLHAGTNTASL